MSAKLVQLLKARLVSSRQPDELGDPLSTRISFRLQLHVARHEGTCFAFFQLDTFPLVSTIGRGPARHSYEAALADLTLARMAPTREEMGNVLRSLIEHAKADRVPTQPEDQPLAVQQGSVHEQRGRSRSR